jgi:translation initiation factor RLI1
MCTAHSQPVPCEADRATRCARVPSLSLSPAPRSRRLPPGVRRRRSARSLRAQVLDYLSDFICCLYGVPGAYGVVTMPFSVREGINIFLAGFIPTENLRFREDALTFRVAEADERAGENDRVGKYTYPAMTKTMGAFKLEVKEGRFSESEIVVLLGQNGTGKTTFIRMLAGMLEADDGNKERRTARAARGQGVRPGQGASLRQAVGAS